MSHAEAYGPLDRDVTLRQGASVLACRVGTDLVLLDSAGGRYYSIDEVGATIFEQVGAGRSLGEIHAVLVDTYDAESEVLWSDLVAFCGRMTGLGLFARHEP